MAIIQANQVTKRFGDIQVLNGVDLEIPRGEVIALIGKSGSGKSTFLRCLNGLEPIDDGSIRIEGEHLPIREADLRQVRTKVGMIFQQFNLFPHMTAGGNVMISQTVVKRTPKDEAREIARETLSRVGLADKFDSYPSQLSGGQQQRVAIARALAMRPVALLCDEVTSALDPELVQEVLNVVRKLAQEGMTLIMVTHEMRFAKEVCDRVAFMHQGKLHEIGPPETVFSNPQTTELQQFLGRASL